MISVVCSSVSTTVTTISLLYYRSGDYCIFFATERTLDLSVHPQEEPFLCGSCLCLWLACIFLSGSGQVGLASTEASGNIGGSVGHHSHGHRIPYATAGLRTPNALIARSFIRAGSRSPVAVTLTIDLAINSVIGSSRLVRQRSINAPSYAAVITSISSGPNEPLAINR
jgi:hypothetical protein